MDERVRDEHRRNQGVVREIGTPFPSGETYPSAPNCRCHIAPVVKI
jgi:uncharacterized protein with gpF-like domain